MLHGTYVVDKAGGGYQTEQVQTGTVGLGHARRRIQVTSKDGFKADYVVPKGSHRGRRARRHRLGQEG